MTAPSRPETTQTDPDPDAINSRKKLLRLSLVLSLLASAVVCGVVSYWFTDQLETDAGIQMYESIAATTLTGAQSNTLRKAQGANVMTSIMRHAFPDANQWPFVALDGFTETASKVAEVSSANSVTLVVFVRPEEAPEWETHAQQVYTDQGYPPETGVYNFGFGIGGRHQNGTEYHDTTGEPSYDSPYSTMAPVFQIYPHAPHIPMFNLHQAKHFGKPIDSMFACAEEKAKEVEASIQDVSTLESCGVVTDFLDLGVLPGPAGLVYRPIYPKNDETKLVGFIGTRLRWEEVFEDIIPQFAGELQLVISTDTASYTYSCEHGVPRFQGPGDLHDRSFDEYARSTVLNDVKTEATEYATYTLTIYPTSGTFSAYRSHEPLAVAFSFVGVIVFCTALFFLYDCFVKVEVRQRKRALEMKRRFVRFISHEIRVPLNTVVMGLELLQGDLRARLPETNDKAVVATDGVMKPNGDERQWVPFSYWFDLTGDILENVNNAVFVLNDLLNYDKIETGNIKLDVGVVNVWRLAAQTVSEFQLEAKNRQVALSFSTHGSRSELEKSDGDEEDAQKLQDSLFLMGDQMKIKQVIRNLISNAIKFTTAGKGSIAVSVSHISDGLPYSEPLSNKYMNDLPKAAELAASAERSGSVRVTVKDTGRGMTHDQLRLLFREGQQFDPNRTQAGGGSGLGLYISKSIVEQHEGSIQAQSEGRGCGTTFVVELPLYYGEGMTAKRFRALTASADEDDDDEEEEDDPSCSETCALTAAASQPLHRRILVVDDVLSNSKMLSRLLQRAGHDCIVANNGQEAIDAYITNQQAIQQQDETPIDTILMDFEMPILDGPDATRRLREMGCSALILGVTGNLFASDVDHFRESGADQVLGKPVKMSQLESCWAGSNSTLYSTTATPEAIDTGGESLRPESHPTALVP